MIPPLATQVENPGQLETLLKLLLDLLRSDPSVKPGSFLLEPACRPVKNAWLTTLLREKFYQSSISQNDPKSYPSFV